MYSFATWDKNGKPNNYGIKPISVIGEIALSIGQVLGSWSFSPPAGHKIGFMVGVSETYTYEERRRTIKLNGNTITVSSAGNNSVGVDVFVADKSSLIVFVEVL